MTAPAVIYHLAPAEHYESCDDSAPYVPEGFEAEGFIHCTDGIRNVVDVGNRYYRADPQPYVLLAIDPARVQAEIRYEDAARIYPHIHGPLNRDAIVAVAPMRRSADGTFEPPTTPSA